VKRKMAVGGSVGVLVADGTSVGISIRGNGCVSVGEVIVVGINPAPTGVEVFSPVVQADNRRRRTKNSLE
jgi:hypothetical protein